MRTVPTLLLAVAVLLGVVVSGCSVTVPGSPAAARPGVAPAQPAAERTTDPTAWTNQLCGAMLPFLEVGLTPVKVDKSSDSAAARSFAANWGQLVDAADRTLSALDAVGPAPVAGVENEVSSIRTSISRMRDLFAEGKKVTDAAGSGDAQALNAAAVQAYNHITTGLQKVRSPLSDFVENPVLAAAAQRAPDCRRVIHPI